MSFLAPLAFWIAAAAVPVLIILYLLKLRRRREPISSTFLWRRAVQDLQVNAPFQRLRRNLLLLLQLLVLLAGITALARPVVQTTLSKEQRVVLLIDRSASMNVVEPDGRTRLEHAKEQAARMVRTLNQSTGRWLSLFGVVENPTQVMVIAYADRATVISPFATDMSEVVTLIERIEPTDAQTNLREALELAEAYMAQTTLEQTPGAGSRVVLLSDGAVWDAEDVGLRAATVEYIPIGERRDNVGITAMRIGRNYERPEMLSIFTQVQNFGPEPVTTDLSLYVDGQLQTVESIALGPARHRAPEAPAAETPAGELGADAPGPIDASPQDSQSAATAAISREVVLDRAAVLEMRLARRDALPTDNSAYAVAPAPRKLSVLLVSEKNFFLENVLRYLPLERFEYMTPQQYESAPDEQIEQDGRCMYDVVVLDKHDTARLPAGNYLFIRSAPKVEGFEIGEEVGPFFMIWWDDTHPVLRNVNLNFVYAAGGAKLKLPEGAQVLIEGPHGPVLARYAREGRQFLILGFAIEQAAQTWALTPGFAIFMYNAIRYLASDEGIAQTEPLRPGDALRIALPAGVEQATLHRPDGEEADVRADASGVARYAATTRVGVYRAQPGIEGRARFAVNLEDARESDIAPRERPDLGPAVEVQVGQQIETATPEIWRWFVGTALLIALIEWVIYNRRVML